MAYLRTKSCSWKLDHFSKNSFVKPGRPRYHYIMALHPITLWLRGRSRARAKLAAGNFNLDGEFVGALGELAAARILGAKIVSDKVDSHDLKKGTFSWEVKATFAFKYKNPRLSKKRFHRYCEIILERRGNQIWVKACHTRRRGGLSALKRQRPVYHKKEIFYPFRVL